VYNLVLLQTKGYTNEHQGNTEKNENAVQECARTEGVGLGERSELRSSRKVSRKYGLRF
jgi:hypothetical protein